MNLLEGAQNLINQVSGEFIEACCPGQCLTPRFPPRPQPPAFCAAQGGSHAAGPQATRSGAVPVLGAGQAAWRSGSLETHLEAPDVVHLPAEVEVQLGDQNPVPVAGEPRGATAIRGRHIARAVKVAEVPVS